MDTKARRSIRPIVARDLFHGERVTGLRGAHLGIAKELSRGQGADHGMFLLAGKDSTGERAGMEFPSGIYP